MTLQNCNENGLCALNEFELIARLTMGITAQEGVNMGVGDDCAVLDLQGDLLLLATCDSQVEGIHFTLQTSSPEQIGRKALGVNLSDIAAMGGVPRYALVSLILPSHLSLDVIDAVYVGLRAEAEKYKTAIVGGNIAGSGKADLLALDITLLGMVERGHVLMRNGAHVGDTVCVTGFLGDAAAGLYTLLHPEQEYPEEAVARTQAAQRTPQPRIREGRVLGQFGPQIVTAMLDVSDGLSGDLHHLCTQSGVGTTLVLEHFPLSPALRAVAATTGKNPFDWAVHGGEDYELLFTVAPGQEARVINAVRSATGTPVTAIGTIQPASRGLVMLHGDRHEEPLVVKSWDHLQTS